MARLPRAPWSGLPLTLKAKRLGLTAKKYETWKGSDGWSIVSDSYAQPIGCLFHTYDEATAYLDGFKHALDLVRTNQQLKQEAA